MAVTSYYSVRSELVGQRSASRTDFLYDALGSVTSTANSSGSILNKYRYKPFGAELSKTGSGPDPKMRWVGTWGYRSAGQIQAVVNTYVRARHYSSSGGRWSSADPRDGDVQRYSYADNSPVSVVDPTGLSPQRVPKAGDHDHWKAVAYHAQSFYKCYLENGGSLPSPQRRLEACKYCKEKYRDFPGQRRGMPRQCADFVASHPHVPLRDVFSVENPQIVNYARVRNLGDCLVRVCWFDVGAGKVHCYDLLPGEATPQNYDIDVVCFCGKAYKISNFNQILVENNYMHSDASFGIGRLASPKYPPIYSCGSVPDPVWLAQFDETCRDALKFVTGNCCKNPKVGF